MESQELRSAQLNLRPEEENEQYTPVSHLNPNEEALDEQVDDDEDIDEE